ncbi:hypothetical protein Hanom_Chr04g00300641 [Helianthus anomalus]
MVAHALAEAEFYEWMSESLVKLESQMQILFKEFRSFRTTWEAQSPTSPSPVSDTALPVPSPTAASPPPTIAINPRQPTATTPLHTSPPPKQAPSTNSSTPKATIPPLIAASARGGPTLRGMGSPDPNLFLKSSRNGI